MADTITDEQLAEVHPLALAVIAHCDEAGRDYNLKLEAQDVVDLREGLAELYGSEDLRTAVKQLLSLCGSLSENGCPVIHQQLYDLLAEQPILDALDALNAARENAAESNSEKFSEFTGKDKVKSAPKPGEERPDGALTIDNLKFPKRL